MESQNVAMLTFRSVLCLIPEPYILLYRETYFYYWTRPHCYVSNIDNL